MYNSQFHRGRSYDRRSWSELEYMYNQTVRGKFSSDDSLATSERDNGPFSIPRSFCPNWHLVERFRVPLWEHLGPCVSPTDSHLNRSSHRRYDDRSRSKRISDCEDLRKRHAHEKNRSSPKTYSKHSRKLDRKMKYLGGGSEIQKTSERNVESQSPYLSVRLVKDKLNNRSEVKEKTEKSGSRQSRHVKPKEKESKKDGRNANRTEISKGTGDKRDLAQSNTETSQSFEPLEKVSVTAGRYTNCSDIVTGDEDMRERIRRMRGKKDELKSKQEILCKVPRSSIQTIIGVSKKAGKKASSSEVIHLKTGKNVRSKAPRNSLVQPSEVNLFNIDLADPSLIISARLHDETKERSNTGNSNLKIGPHITDKIIVPSTGCFSGKDTLYITRHTLDSEGEISSGISCNNGGVSGNHSQFKVAGQAPEVDVPLLMGSDAGIDVGQISEERFDNPCCAFMEADLSVLVGRGVENVIRHCTELKENETDSQAQDPTKIEKLSTITRAEQRTKDGERNVLLGAEELNMEESTSDEEKKQQISVEGTPKEEEIQIVFERISKKVCTCRCPPKVPSEPRTIATSPKYTSVGSEIVENYPLNLVLSSINSKDNTGASEIAEPSLSQSSTCQLQQVETLSSINVQNEVAGKAAVDTSRSAGRSKYPFLDNGVEPNTCIAALPNVLEKIVDVNLENIQTISHDKQFGCTEHRNSHDQTTTCSGPDDEKSIIAIVAVEKLDDSVGCPKRPDLQSQAKNLEATESFNEELNMDNRKSLHLLDKTLSCEECIGDSHWYTPGRVKDKACNRHSVAVEREEVKSRSCETVLDCQTSCQGIATCVMEGRKGSSEEMIYVTKRDVQCDGEGADLTLLIPEAEPQSLNVQRVKVRLGQDATSSEPGTENITHLVISTKGDGEAKLMHQEIPEIKCDAIENTQGNKKEHENKEDFGCRLRDPDDHLEEIPVSKEIGLSDPNANPTVPPGKEGLISCPNPRKDSNNIPSLNSRQIEWHKYSQGAYKLKGRVTRRRKFSNDGKETRKEKYLEYKVTRLEAGKELKMKLSLAKPKYSEVNEYEMEMDGELSGIDNPIEYIRYLPGNIDSKSVTQNSEIYEKKFKDLQAMFNESVEPTAYDEVEESDRGLKDGCDTSGIVNCETPVKCTTSIVSRMDSGSDTGNSCVLFCLKDQTNVESTKDLGKGITPYAHPCSQQSDNLEMSPNTRNDVKNHQTCIDVERGCECNSGNPTETRDLCNNIIGQVSEESSEHSQLKSPSRAPSKLCSETKNTDRQGLRLLDPTRRRRKLSQENLHNHEKKRVLKISTPVRDTDYGYYNGERDEYVRTEGSVRQNRTHVRQEDVHSPEIMRRELEKKFLSCDRNNARDRPNVVKRVAQESLFTKGIEQLASSHISEDDEVALTDVVRKLQITLYDSKRTSVAPDGETSDDKGACSNEETSSAVGNSPTLKNDLSPNSRRSHEKIGKRPVTPIAALSETPDPAKNQGVPSKTLRSQSLELPKNTKEFPRSPSLDFARPLTEIVGPRLRYLKNRCKSQPVHDSVLSYSSESPDSPDLSLTSTTAALSQSKECQNHPRHLYKGSRYPFSTPPMDPRIRSKDSQPEILRFAKDPRLRHKTIYSPGLHDPRLTRKCFLDSRTHAFVAFDSFRKQGTKKPLPYTLQEIGTSPRFVPNQSRSHSALVAELAKDSNLQRLRSTYSSKQGAFTVSSHRGKGTLYPASAPCSVDVAQQSFLRKPLPSEESATPSPILQLPVSPCASCFCKSPYSPSLAPLPVPPPTSSSEYHPRPPLPLHSPPFPPPTSDMITPQIESSLPPHFHPLKEFPSFWRHDINSSAHFQTQDCQYSNGSPSFHSVPTLNADWAKLFSVPPPPLHSFYPGVQTTFPVGVYHNSPHVDENSAQPKGTSISESTFIKTNCCGLGVNAT